LRAIASIVPIAREGIATTGLFQKFNHFGGRARRLSAPRRRPLAMPPYRRTGQHTSLRQKVLRRGISIWARSAPVRTATWRSLSSGQLKLKQQKCGARYASSCSHLHETSWVASPRTLGYFVKAAIWRSNQASWPVQSELSRDSFTSRAMIACPRRSAASASLGSLDCRYTPASIA
jgi:hypothetical protein